MQTALYRLFWIYLVFVIVVSLIPTPGLHLERIKIGLGPFELRADYFLHMLMFLGFYIVFIFIKYYKVVLFKNKPFLTLLILSSSIAVFTETLQLFIPGRSFYVTDLLANIAGIVIGILLVRFSESICDKSEKDKRAEVISFRSDRNKTN